MSLFTFEEITGVRIGDQVKLLHSQLNWDSDMTKIVDNNPIVTVTDIYYDGSGNKHCIEFEEAKNFQWTFEDGHYTFYDRVNQKIDTTGLHKILTELEIA